MTPYELAKKYYPRLWGKDRMDKLLDAGKISREQYEEITREAEHGST